MRIRFSTLLLAAPFGLALTACGAETESPHQTAELIEWAAPVEVDSGRAYQGPWQMNESRFLYVDDPAVALVEDGVVMAWVDNAEQQVLFQRFDDDGRPVLDGPVVVSRSPDIFSWLPRLAVDGNDRIHVAWQEILFTGGSHGGEILIASSSDGGHSFSEPVNLSKTTAGAGKGRLTPQRWDNGSLDLAVDASGRVVVAWTEYEGALRLAWSDEHGENFGQPRHVSGSDEQPARAPALALGPDGRVWLAWSLGGSPQADIHLAHSEDLAGGFSELLTIHPADGHADAPRLVVDDDGTVHLVYTQSDTAPFNNSSIVYTRGKDDSFSEPVTVSDDPENNRVVAAYPQLALAAGRVMVSWEQSPRSGVRPEDVGYAVLIGDGEFSRPATVPGNLGPGRNGGNQGLLMRKLDGNDGGRLALGHATWHHGEASRVWLLSGRIR